MQRNIIRFILIVCTVGISAFLNDRFVFPNIIKVQSFSENLYNSGKTNQTGADMKATSDPPVLLTPADGTMNINTRPTLTWEFSAEAIAWHLQVSHNESFSSTIYEDTTISTNLRQVGALTCSHIFYWRVRVKTADGWSGFSSIFSFNTHQAPQHTTISIRSSFVSPGSRPSGLTWDGRSLWMVDNLRNIYKMDTAGNVITSFPVPGFSDDRGLTWDGTGLWIVVGIQNYKMDTLGNVIDSLDVQHWWHSGLDWDGKYWWFGDYNLSILYKHNREGGEILNFELNDIFGHPTGLAYDGINMWVGASGEGFTDDIFKYSTMGTYLYEFDLGTVGFSPTPGSYAALAWDGQSLWYATDDQFTIYRLNVPYYHQVPAVPSLILPANGDGNVITTPNLCWNPAESAETYDLQVATDDSFNNIVFDISDITATSYQLATLGKMTIYYWHVRASNSVGSSLFSATHSFTTGGLDIQSDSLALVAFYNSTNGANWTNNFNWLTGPLSTWVGITISGNRVTEISFDHNNLSGTIPPQIGDLTDLQVLNLPDNQISGTIPVEIGNLTNLEYLDLNMNLLTGLIPAEIGNLTNLEHFHLWLNQLTGIIPAAIGNMTSLEEINLSGNQLSGSLPPEIGSLSNLRELILESNDLSGTLPAEIWTLTNLAECKFSQNHFTGTIPTEIGNLVNLSAFLLCDNNFTGEIPAEILNATNLYWLWIYDNNFTDLPDLSSLSNLNLLYIQDNRFTFEDIEPNIGVPSGTFNYANQDSVGLKETVIKALNASHTVSVNVGGTSNEYQWYLNGNIIPGATGTTYTIDNLSLADFGEYTCQITNTVATELTLYSRPIILVPDRIIVTDATEFVEDFESNNGNWTAGGTNSSWEYGSPSGGTTINSAASGLNIWKTNLSGTYYANEASWVTSPLFDISTLSSPAVEMKIWWECEGAYDGSCFQYSVDNGTTWITLQKATDYLWYNRSDLTTLYSAFGSLNGWSGDGTFGQGSGDWLTVVAPLTGLSGEPNIKFRFAFASNGVYEKDGFAFDDVKIYNNPVAGIASYAETGDLNIYPNPFGEKTTIEFNNPLHKSYRLTITDLSGKAIRIVDNITDTRYELDRRDLSRGFYFIELKGDNIFRGKILVE